jgi:hypothetical protein
MKLLVNVEPTEVAQIAIAMKVINMAVYAGMIGYCYKRHPLQVLDRRFLLQQRLQTKWPTIFAYGHQMYTRTTQICVNNQWFQKTMQRFKLEPRNTIETIAEASILYKCGLPVILPVSFLAAAKLTSSFNRKPLTFGVSQFTK